MGRYLSRENLVDTDPTLCKTLIFDRSAAGRRAVTHCQEHTDVLYLRRENVTFIEPRMWLPNSPDLNPVDCAAWGALQQMVYQRRRFTTINQLKQAIVTEWGKLLQRFIDRAIGQWRRRLEWVVI